ncbi:Zinc finger MYM-type protein 1 [Holothuria leucospilota]|uniref:Zinc finger MYM-type protein 1 n=1 Tax=Holothuria leucospilota TaxID=206669 RepID=A0A9Q1H3T7_HOLLE|nr:Zinc finger MYM-type protein 1 [Holothuria leucospilota]
MGPHRPDTDRPKADEHEEQSPITLDESEHNDENPCSSDEWTDSVAGLSRIAQLADECKRILNDMKKADIPNVEFWMVEARETVSCIQENCSQFLETTDKVLQLVQADKRPVHQGSIKSSIEHDPALRGQEKADPAWVDLGVRTWHKMKSLGKDTYGRLAKHFASESHRASLSAYCSYINKNWHIDVQLDKATRNARIQEAEDLAFNRKVGSGDDKDGNYYQIVQLLGRHVPILRRWLSDRRSMNPYHVTYLSPQSQNELISLLETELCQRVVEEVHAAGMFSVMADTTPDESHTAQLSVVVRYVTESGKPVERLLAVNESLDKTGKGQAGEIVSAMDKLGLDTAELCYQSYDFAAAMSGQFSGAQKELSDIVGRKILYIPCQAHRTKRFQPLKDQVQTVEKGLMLRNLSKTRWSARAESIQAVWTSFETIVAVLGDIGGNPKIDKMTQTKAFGLKKRILDLDFIVTIMFMKNIMYKSKNLVEKLQKVDVNVLDAAALAEATMKVLDQI